jgi:hypothetical protein
MQMTNKKEENLCNALFTGSDFKDVTGCLKHYAHNDHHVCRTADDRLMAWENDYGCECGCWEDGDGDVCRVYWEVVAIS